MIELSCRPHGQHAVVLADDASRYMENRYERNNLNPGPIVSGSKQIYLTFPADSTFSEDDVANYFRYYLVTIFRCGKMGGSSGMDDRSIKQLWCWSSWVDPRPCFAKLNFFD